MGQMKFHRRRGQGVALGGVLILLAGSGVWAADEQGSGQLEEVIVTATRRADTNLQTTPISVTAVTSADIERMVAKDISGLASSVPGFSASRITAFNAASFAMRGVGVTDIIVYQDSPVGVQVDDFVMPSVQTQLLDAFDIATAEVLRGPQGTLFGKNTTGGAVNIRTKRPNMQEAGGELRLGVAKFGEKQVQGALDLPIIDNKLALRVVGSYIKTDGYYHLGATWGPIVTFTAQPIAGITGTSGVGNGARAGGQDTATGRIKLQWNVTDDVTALFQYEVLRDRSDAVPSYNDTPPGAPYLWNTLGFTRPVGDPLDHVGSTQRDDALIEMSKGQKIDVDGGYANIDWKINSHFTLYSVTGFRKQTEHLPNTYTGTAPINTVTGQTLSLFDASRDTNRNTFQQELRLASALDGPVNFVVGGFYQRNDASFCVVQLLGFVDLVTDFAALGLPAQFLNNSPQIGCNRSSSKSTAGFVDVTWDVNDRFQLGAGYRQTQDEKTWEGRPQTGYSALDPTGTLTVADFSSVIQAADFARYPGVGFDPVACTASLVNYTSRFTCDNGKVLDFSNLKTKWSEPSWRLTGSYKITPEVFSYVTISRGYKAGGYNDQTGTSGILVPELTRPVNPEFANNYELGFKTQWLDNRLRINPTFFYTKYSDAQRAINVNAVNTAGAQFQETVFYNAAKVKSKGVELEVQALITDNFRARMAGSWLDAKYDQFLINQPGITTASGAQILPIVNLDLSGQPVPRSPKKSLSVSGSYDWQLASAGKLELSGEVYYEDKNLFYTSAAGRAYDAYLDSKVLVNAVFGYTSEDGRYYARLYGKNLGDKRYRVASQSVAQLWIHSQFGEPRNYGLQVGMKFGSAAGK